MQKKGITVAITGGIGSGKSHVCRILQQKGIDVYDCDEAAKRLMRDDPSLQTALKQQIGPHVYVDNVLQKAVLAQFILASEANKQKVNDIVHPAVAADFLQSAYTWIESALLFDAHFDKRVHPDKVICVSAPYELRLERIMNRDAISCEKAAEWIERQMSQEEMLQRSDYEIKNDGQHDLQQQIEQIVKTLTT